MLCPSREESAHLEWQLLEKRLELLLLSNLGIAWICRGRCIH